MKITILKNKYFTGVLWIIVIALFGVSFLIHIYSYFNTKEINSASSQCYENGGEVKLKIYNNLTSDYYFECKKK
ncbi:hypothetical protein ACQKND_05650 [Viridibacillus arvi]|uniref:hypothetical protein n=1 Tax=Viridibacillus arvi TaxID=263475 RepID=UPI003CFD5D37